MRNFILKHKITISVCVLLLVFGFGWWILANPGSTTIGEDISVGGKLQVAGTTKTNGWLYAGITDPADIDTARLNYAGWLYATRFYGRGFYYFSDQSLKENIQPLSNALEKILALQGVEFNFKDDTAEQKSIGLIAQEAEEILPEIVSQSEGSGLKSVDYSKVVPVLIEAVKELKQQIDRQQQQIEELTAELELLKLSQ